MSDDRSWYQVQQGVGWYYTQDPPPRWKIIVVQAIALPLILWPLWVSLLVLSLLSLLCNLMGW